MHHHPGYSGLDIWIHMAARSGGITPSVRPARIDAAVPLLFGSNMQAGDYGGPMFLLPGLVIVWHLTGRLDELLSAAHVAAASIYLRNHQQADGGWGTHIESQVEKSPSTLPRLHARSVAAKLFSTSGASPSVRPP